MGVRNYGEYDDVTYFGIKILNPVQIWAQKVKLAKIWVGSDWSQNCYIGVRNYGENDGITIFDIKIINLVQI